MPFFVRCFTAIAFALVAGLSLANSTGQWWEYSPWSDPERRFYWYPDPKLDEEAVEPLEGEAEPLAPPKTIYEMTELEDLQKELVRLKGVAVMNPTDENVLTYLRAQTFVFDKSSMFADVSRRVVWQNPEIDYSGRSSTANFARLNDQKRLAERRDQLMAKLAETHALLYFSREDCPYCQDQAPVLKAFAHSTGMKVMAISMDGRPVAHFPDAKPDNGISFMATGGDGIEMVPAIFLIDKQTSQMTRLGVGVIAGSDLAERIRVLTSTMPGEEF